METSRKRFGSASALNWAASVAARSALIGRAPLGVQQDPWSPAGSGNRSVRADGVFVRRLPPALRHFAGQRVRQSYDSQTQPARLAVELLLLPLLLVLVRRPAACGALAATAVVLAEAGRRRAGGTQVFDG